LRTKDHYYFFEEVARGWGGGGERTRVLSISFIFLFSHAKNILIALHFWALAGHFIPFVF
jgi:hypothetical protein